MIKVEHLYKSFDGVQVLKDINVVYEPGKCNMIMAKENEISLLCSNMPHGYHRDFQLLKDVLFPALENMHKCLFMGDYMLQHIIVKDGILDAPIYDYLFTVEEVNRRTLEGIPFRDAYKTVGIEVNEGKGKKYTIQRSKGLGENQPDMMWQTTMNPETRSLIKVSITDAALAEKRVSVLMGDKVEPRKEWINENVDFTLEDSFRR